LLEYRLKRTLPTFAKRWNPERAFHLLARVSRQIEQAIDLRYGHSFWTIADFDDDVTWSNLPLLQNAKVKAGPSVVNDQRGHSRFVHANAQAIAGYARLCYLEYRIPNAISITDADLVIGKSFNGEILSELSETKIITNEKALPVMVGVYLVNKHRALLATMTGEIGLRVAIDIQLAHHPSSLDRKLPNRRSHSLAVPCDVAWKTDI